MKTGRLLSGLLILATLFQIPVDGIAGDDKSSSVQGKTEGLSEKIVGKEIYVRQCQSCHGEGGIGGTDGYSEKLVGDASIGELAEIISDTMPEEDPDLCNGEDARAVAEYIHDAFYGEAAQLRRRPPRRQLSRLTANQLRQSLADLYQHFHGTIWRETKRGLHGSYFNAGRWDKKQLKLERDDSTVSFDFGRDAPANGIEAKEFYIHWNGSLLAPSTGRYEIVVQSTCSMKLRFGHHDKVLIDNHVQSEGKDEFRRTLKLVGGRHYPILIDFTQRKRKTEQPPAKMSLRWVPPGGTEQVIPSEFLIPATFPSAFALQTKFPPDDRSYGYDRGTRVDAQWNDAVTAAALEFGVAASEELWPHYERRHRKDPNENRARLRAFLNELAGVAFRRPLDDANRKLYIDRQLDAAPDDKIAIQRTCLLVLTSPRFLYPLLDQDAPISNRVANRLALTLFDSLPTGSALMGQIRDDHFNLERKGAENRVRNIARKMAGDPRLEGKAMEMFYQWLDVDPTAEVVKSTETYPGFDQGLVWDLQRSLRMTLGEIFWSDSSDYRELFRRDWNWTNARLANFYGENWQAPETDSSDQADSDPGLPASQQLVKSRSADSENHGVLTHPSLMSHLSYYDTTSPIHRGVFLIRKVLGRTLRPPNEAFTPLNPTLHPDLTTRQRVELQTAEAKCQVCHLKINALGFPLENYDAVGRYRAEEKGKVVDATGNYTTRKGQEVTFSSAADLAKFLAENEDAHRAFVERVFEHFAKQPMDSYGADVVDRLVKGFRDSNYHMRELIVEIAVIVAMQQLDQENAHEST